MSRICSSVSRTVVWVGLAQARHELTALLDIANVGTCAAAEAVQVCQVALGVHHRLALDVVRRLRKLNTQYKHITNRAWSSFTLIMAFRAEPTWRRSMSPAPIDSISNLPLSRPRFRDVCVPGSTELRPEPKGVVNPPCCCCCASSSLTLAPVPCARSRIESGTGVYLPHREEPYENITALTCPGACA